MHKEFLSIPAVTVKGLADFHVLQGKLEHGGGGKELPLRIGKEACPIFLGLKILKLLKLFGSGYLPVQVYIFGFSCR